MSNASSTVLYGGYAYIMEMMVRLTDQFMWYAVKGVDFSAATFYNTAESDLKVPGKVNGEHVVKK